MGRMTQITGLKEAKHTFNHSPMAVRIYYDPQAQHVWAVESPDLDNPPVYDKHIRLLARKHSRTYMNVRISLLRKMCEIGVNLNDPDS
jgi:hypothetical protein